MPGTAARRAPPRPGVSHTRPPARGGTSAHRDRRDSVRAPHLRRPRAPDTPRFGAVPTEGASRASHRVPGSPPRARAERPFGSQPNAKNRSARARGYDPGATNALAETGPGPWRYRTKLEPGTRAGLGGKDPLAGALRGTPRSCASGFVQDWIARARSSDRLPNGSAVKLQPHQTQVQASACTPLTCG